jgi:predicted TIM-barrel fold metal-dependent hydrolase
VFLDPDTREGVLAAQEIAKAFPGMKFILLGMGGDAWRTAAAAASQTLNLVLETSGSLSPDKIGYAMEMIGSHRMVFGSNLPFTDPAITIGLVEDADIPDADKKMIFQGTARKIFTAPREEDFGEEE